MSTDTPLNSAQHLDPIGGDLPELSDVRTGVDFALSIGQEILQSRKYNTQIWGYDDSREVVDEIGETFGPQAATLLNGGESTQAVRANLFAKIAGRLAVIEVTVLLIASAIGIIRNKAGAISHMEQRSDGFGIRINHVRDEAIGSVVRKMKDVIGRILRHGDTVSPRDIYYSVEKILKEESPA